MGVSGPTRPNQVLEHFALLRPKQKKLHWNFFAWSSCNLKKNIFIKEDVLSR